MSICTDMAVIAEIQQDDNGDLFIEIPDDVLDSVGWSEGDCLEWSMRGDALVLNRIGDGAEYIDDSM